MSNEVRLYKMLQSLSNGQITNVLWYNCKVEHRVSNQSQSPFSNMASAGSRHPCISKLNIIDLVILKA